MRMTYKAGLSFLLLLCLAGTPVHAQEPPVDDGSVTTRLMQFAANNMDFDHTVETTARGLFARTADNCSVIDKAVRQLPTSYGELAFPDDPRAQYLSPTKGIWAEHVKIKACGKVWTINMLAIARAKEAPLLLALLPGETLSDPASQRSAERVGAISIKKADAESCADDAHAAYTRLLGFRQADGTVGKTDVNEGWFEEWTYRFCQKMIPVQMAFLPNDKGGFDIKARIVPSVMPQMPASKPVAAPEPVAPAPAPAAPISGLPAQ